VEVLAEGQIKGSLHEEVESVFYEFLKMFSRDSNEKETRIVYRYEVTNIRSKLRSKEVYYLQSPDIPV
jgi:hypothetical protein